MKKRLSIILLLLLVINISLPAGTDEEIKKLATMILETDEIQTKKSTSGFSIITSKHHKGFVIISKTEMSQVLGYSKESDYNEEEIPPLIMEWLNKLEDKIRYSKSSLRTSVKNNIEKRTSILPLIKTHWHQSSPYNDYAPVITDGNVKTAAGCVAIAGAQATYYWWKDNPQATLKDTPIYPYGAAPVTFSIPKGTSNNWELIKTEYNVDDTYESKDAVARLCYVIGTTSYLNYASSTGGQIHEAAKAMSSQYDLEYDILYHSNCTQEQWDSLLYHEVSNGRPVICSGQSSIGHAFILDGYDSETNLYHFNFGWGGEGDGYYPVDDSEYSMGGYRNSQSIIYNIHPRKRNILTNINIVDIDEDFVHILIEIKNCSTLPAKIKLLSNSTTSFQGDNQIFWQEIVDNNGISMTYQVDIEKDPSINTIELMLFDEYGTLLCELKQDVINSIHNHCVDNNVFICDIQGHRVRKNMGNSIYIIKGKTNYIKVWR